MASQSEAFFVASFQVQIISCHAETNLMISWAQLVPLNCYPLVKNHL